MTKPVVLSLISILFISCGESTSTDRDFFTVSGTIKGSDASMIYLEARDIVENHTVLLDSAAIEDQSFSFQGQLEHADQVSIRTDKEQFRLFLENKDVSVDIDLNRAKDLFGDTEIHVTGSPLDALFKEQKEKEMAIWNADKYQVLNDLREAFSNIDRSADDAMEKRDQLMQEMKKHSSLTDERAEALLESKIEFVERHPESPVAGAVLGFTFSESRMSKEQMAEVFPLFKEGSKNTRIYKHIEKVYADVFETFGPGAPAPDFTLSDLEGDPISFYEIDAELILVDFWASWCVPCREAFPHLKELYAKYNDSGFEILAVATEDKDLDWRQAIEKDQTPFIHVWDPKGENTRMGMVADLFAVPFLPTTYLVDKDKIIIGRNLSYEDLDHQLEESFGF